MAALSYLDILAAGGDIIARQNAERALSLVFSTSGQVVLGGIAPLLGDPPRIYASRASLNADLTPGNGLYALVMGDATLANNDLYRKSGATGTGSWSAPLGLFAAANGAAEARLAKAANLSDLTNPADALTNLGLRNGGATGILDLIDQAIALKADDADLAAEIARATAAEDANADAIANVGVALDAEITRATDADADFDARLDAREADIDGFIAGLASEISRATGAEDALALDIGEVATALDAENFRAVARENELDGAITSVGADLIAEAERAEAAEGALDTRLTAAEGDIDAIDEALGNEITRAYGAEAALAAADLAESKARARNDDLTRRRTTAAVGFAVGDDWIWLADAAGAVGHTNRSTGKTRIHGLVLDGSESISRGGLISVVQDGQGRDLLSWDVFDRRLIHQYGEVVGRPFTVDFAMTSPTEVDGGDSLVAGYEWGQWVRYVPATLDGLEIQGDDNKIPQLFSVIDSSQGMTRSRRQITYSQWGVTGFQFIRPPVGTTPGLVRIFSNDHDAIKDRQKTRYAQWFVTEPQIAAPTKMVAVLGMSQSNGVGAGSYGPNPTGLKGPMTIRTSMKLRNAPFSSRILGFIGGAIPHQGNLDGDVDIGGGVLARDVPIDAARIASLVPLAEGLGAAGQHAQGGATRESYYTSLATHLNGPWGYDGSAYVVSGGFGFGSSSFAQLVHDGSVRKQAWLNLLAGIDRLKIIADANALALEVHILLDQGEADWSNASYRAQVEAAWTIMKSDITTRSAQAIAPKLFINQTIQARGTFREPAYSGLAQVEMDRNNSDIILMPPHYFTDFDTDTIHHKASEEVQRGALSGEAINDFLQRGLRARLLMNSATWLGSRLTVTMSAPVMRDGETIVLSAANGGLTHNNSAGSTAAVAATLISDTDPTKINITTSTAIDGGAVETARMGWGNQTTTSPASQGWGGGPDGGGQRTVYKRSDWRRYNLIDGRPLDIFASIQEIPATQEL